MSINCVRVDRKPSGKPYGVSGRISLPRMIASGGPGCAAPRPRGRVRCSGTVDVGRTKPSDCLMFPRRRGHRTGGVCRSLPPRTRMGDPRGIHERLQRYINREGIGSFHGSRFFPWCHWDLSQCITLIHSTRVNFNASEYDVGV